MTSSTIHDLGYQRYEGERLPSADAWSALFVHGLRTVFALGRPARAKILPVFVLVFTCLPAFLTVFISSQAGVPVRHANYFSGVTIFVLLFAAAQAPELFSRDQSSRAMPLLLTRDLTRWQYASARLASMIVAVIGLTLVPQLILWLGAIGIADDPIAVLQERDALLGPIFAVTTLSGVLFGTVASAIAAFTPRRHFATAAIVGTFLVLGALSAALGESEVLSRDTAMLLNPVMLLDLANRTLFDEPARRAAAAAREAAHPLGVVIGVIGAYAGACTLAVWWRSQRVQA